MQLAHKHPCSTHRLRYSLPHARILIHQPLGGFSGQASDIDIQAQEILRTRERLNKILSHHTGKKLDKVRKDTDRDYFMTAEEAKTYGLVDEILQPKTPLEEGDGKKGK